MSRTVTLDELLVGVQPLCAPITVPVVDLYAGVGGFRTGCVQAGHTVKIAVDSWPSALQWHSRNHPDTAHYGFSLPDPRLLSRRPEPGTLYHLHGSPPCQLLSQACGNQVRNDQWDDGLENVRYFLDLARERKPASFSMEEVANKQVLNFLDEYMKLYPEFMDYAIINMSNYGVPQARVRVIAGSPWLIQRLCDTKHAQPKVRVRDACKTVPKNAAGIKGQRGTKGHKNNDLKSASCPVFKKPSNKLDMDRRAIRGGLAAPSPTVCCTNMLRWAGPGGHTVRCLTLHEHATIQSFPDHYRFPTDDRKTAQRLVGNSVPPKFAQHFMSNYRLPLHLQHLPPAVFPPRPPSPSV